MSIDEKITAINDYNASIGSAIRYERMMDGHCYRTFCTDYMYDYDEVSEGHINEAYEEVISITKNK